MKLRLETENPQELDRYRRFLETYFEGLDDPLGCEPACRDLTSPGCDHCVKEHIDYLVNRLKEKREISI